jgi:hypothetical protein
MPHNTSGGRYSSGRRGGFVARGLYSSFDTADTSNKVMFEKNLAWQATQKNKDGCRRQPLVFLQYCQLPQIFYPKYTTTI